MPRYALVPSRLLLVAAALSSNGLGAGCQPPSAPSGSGLELVVHWPADSATEGPPTFFSFTRTGAFMRRHPHGTRETGGATTFDGRQQQVLRLASHVPGQDKKLLEARAWLEHTNGEIGLMLFVENTVPISVTTERSVRCFLIVADKRRPFAPSSGLPVGEHYLEVRSLEPETNR